MNIRLRAGVLGVGLVIAALVGDARQEPQKFGAATTAVVIDVVVRDSRGRPVTDLKRADFELLEDGVSQEIGDLTRVGVATPAAARRAPAATATGSAPPAAARPPSQPSVATPTFVALVFDRLTPEARGWPTKGRLPTCRRATRATSRACSCRTFRWCRSRPTPTTAWRCARRSTT